MQKKKILFYQDNAPCHKSMKTMVKLNKLSFELLPHPPYSPDLGPSDYWLFSDLIKDKKIVTKMGCWYRTDVNEMGKKDCVVPKIYFCY